MLKRFLPGAKGASKTTPPPAAQPPAGVAVPKNPGEAFELYTALRRKKADIPVALLHQVGDLFRDTNKPAQAAELYLEAAARATRDEAWPTAQVMLRLAEAVLGRRDARIHLVALDVAIGQGDASAARSAIEALGRVLTPSDGVAIDRALAALDREPLYDLGLEVAVAEFLASLARPDRAGERLRAAKAAAERSGRRDAVDEYARLLAQIEPAAERGARQMFVPAAPAPRDAEPHATAPSASDPTPTITTPVASTASEPETRSLPEVPAVPVAAAQVRGESESEGIRPEELLSGAPADTRFVGEDGLDAVGSDEDAQLAHLVRQLVEGIRRAVPEDEAQTHYDLGVGFLGMGLHEQALERFQLAYRHPAWRDRATEGLAEVFVATGRPALALRAITTTRQSLGAADDQALGLLYWEARALEELGKAPEAVERYERIALYDVAFLDASDRLAALLTS